MAYDEVKEVEKICLRRQRQGLDPLGRIIIFGMQKMSFPVFLFARNVDSGLTVAILSTRFQRMGVRENGLSIRK